MNSAVKAVKSTTTAVSATIRIVSTTQARRRLAGTSA
jgi:hypothetical protein